MSSNHTKEEVYLSIIYIVLEVAYLKIYLILLHVYFKKWIVQLSTFFVTKSVIKKTHNTFFYIMQVNHIHQTNL